MKTKPNYKIGFIIGCALIIIAILIGIIFEHDIAFIFGGMGVVVCGITALIYINKGNE